MFKDIFPGGVVFRLRVILAMLLDETIEDVVDMNVIGVKVFFHGIVVAVRLQVGVDESRPGEIVASGDWLRSDAHRVKQRWIGTT